MSFKPVLTYVAPHMDSHQKENNRIKKTKIKFSKSQMGKTRRERLKNGQLWNRVQIYLLQNYLETESQQWFRCVKTNAMEHRTP